MLQNLTKRVHEKYCLHQEIGERKEVKGGIDRERGREISEGKDYQLVALSKLISFLTQVSSFPAAFLPPVP